MVSSTSVGSCEVGVNEFALSDLNGDQLPAERRGSLDVHPRVLERIAVLAAVKVSGVLVRTGPLRRLRGRRSPDAVAIVERSQATVELNVAAEWPFPVTDLAAEVRNTVLAEVEQLSGLNITAVDVVVHATSPASKHQRGGARVQ